MCEIHALKWSLCYNFFLKICFIIFHNSEHIQSDYYKSIEMDGKMISKCVEHIYNPLNI